MIREPPCIRHAQACESAKGKADAGYALVCSGLWKRADLMLESSRHNTTPDNAPQCMLPPFCIPVTEVRQGMIYIMTSLPSPVCTDQVERAKLRLVSYYAKADLLQQVGPATSVRCIDIV
jgi:hypothetical protein